jgi:hypothetical protein
MEKRLASLCGKRSALKSIANLIVSPTSAANASFSQLTD